MLGQIGERGRDLGISAINCVKVAVRGGAR